MLRTKWGTSEMNQADSKNTVLIVDDSPANIQVVNSILKDIYKIRIATNGAKALELAKATPPPDLILLDVMMPEMDGYEVCTRLKADLETREIPVIFLTGQTEVEDETKGFEVGAVDYIHKPFSPAVVKARVQTHLVLRGITQPVSSRPTGGWPETGRWEITPEKHPDWHHHLDVKRPPRRTGFLVADFRGLGTGNAHSAFWPEGVPAELGTRKRSDFSSKWQRTLGSE